MAKIYERFLKILQNWPANPDYPIPLRSLSLYIRQQGKAAFSARGDFKGDTQQCDKRLKSLERIARGHWSNAYPRERQEGALGLTAEQCRYALSDSYQEVIESSKIYLTYRAIIDSFSSKGKA